MTVFGPLFVPERLLEAVSNEAWLEAMLETERALAAAEAGAGVVPAESAAAIAESCRAELFDIEALAREGRSVGNPAEPLVRALREKVGGEAARYVHWGATSQDVLDSASMLVTRRALDLILAELDRVAGGLAELAQTHRSTPMAARTLLQQAVPTTFGFKVAGWLVAVLEARGRLRVIRTERLAAQLGGAAGTLAPLGERGADVLRLFSEELGLAEPVLPWHTNRTRIAELGGALATTSGVLGKIALDVVLLAQTEVGEVREARNGGSSTLPQKQNPVGATLARACAGLVSGYASVLSHAVAQEHERAAGAWHTEWEALSGALAYTGGAAAGIGDVVAGLEVDTEQMRRNLELTNGLILAERVSYLLSERLGRDTAHAAVREAAGRLVESGRTFGEELRADARIDLSDEELAVELDPTTYLGSTEAFVDRALEHYGRERSEGA
jgi:3-carboxy-cis,cis-muconate cycloisomerase